MMPQMPQMPQQFPAMQPQPTGFQPQSQFGQSQFGQQGMGVGYQQAINQGQQTGSPFADPPRQQFQPTPSGLANTFAPQPTGFQQQPSFPQQPSFQHTQPTGVMNGVFGQAPPQLPPQQTGGVLGPMAPLIPQKTGPPPPVRFGVQPPVPKLVPQKTGRAELSRASKFYLYILIVKFIVVSSCMLTDFHSAAEPFRVLGLLRLDMVCCDVDLKVGLRAGEEERARKRMFLCRWVAFDEGRRDVYIV